MSVFILLQDEHDGIPVKVEYVSEYYFQRAKFILCKRALNAVKNFALCILLSAENQGLFNSRMKKLVQTAYSYSNVSVSNDML